MMHWSEQCRLYYVERGACSTCKTNRPARHRFGVSISEPLIQKAMTYHYANTTAIARCRISAPSDQPVNTRRRLEVYEVVMMHWSEQCRLYYVERGACSTCKTNRPARHRFGVSISEPLIQKAMTYHYANTTAIARCRISAPSDQPVNTRRRLVSYRCIRDSRSRPDDPIRTALNNVEKIDINKGMF
ncbi:hypothetical protein Tcan_18770 [Toxocara canis]|uniref:Uncharacterized protein n=1 Tax=Toxocara canis TaxID=6265 RepID=A0A0B2VPV0_TOXCA|nr:hypothetical protein Tcan_18770 [Toxocara canis]